MTHPGTTPVPVAQADAAGAGEPRPGVLTRMRAAWATVPLVRRLVAIIVVLLGAGLVLAGAASTTLLRRTLVLQADAKLQDEGRRLAQQTVDALSGMPGLGDVGPSDYYVQARIGAVEVPLIGRAPTLAEYGRPHIPDLTVRQAAARAGEPYTVGSSRAASRWRAVTFPLEDGSGYLTVALPQRDLDRAVVSLSRILLLSGIAIVLLGAVTGTWAVRRSLRPLDEIEDTAAAIAAGELSRRVPTASTTTEVGRLAAALNGMLAQIEEAFDARTASEARMRRFVADASHELRTPLATIRGYAELYRMGATTTPEQVGDTMRRIEGSATRMGSLVEDLLALARLDEGRPGRLGPVDLTVLAADAVSDLRALDPDRPARLETGGSPGPVVVQGDEARLRQVLANLVGNAVQHTPAGTPVEVRVGPGGPDGEAPGTAVLEVRDHGPGIAPEHAARVFERFYRVDASRTRESGGSGLGMAIVAAIVTSHEGRVRLTQTPGGGTTVRVVLPVDGPTGGTAAASADVVGRPTSGTAGALPAPDVATMARPTSPS
ncbi:sensor histidine kinase [Cellulomonas telluris]|uniref:sensor histidine kinase n=1 Tax=Cellulomonas telluris TaxID=2306636 RepID=UPI001FE7161B|nr:HAMP domain-containing sensor histidine kinase [Cellulomonas telluris]